MKSCLEALEDGYDDDLPKAMRFTGRASTFGCLAIDRMATIVGDDGRASRKIGVFAI